MTWTMTLPKSMSTQRDPATPSRPIGGRALLLGALDDAFGDRAELPVRRTAADDEVVGHRRLGAHVEQDDVRGLLVGRELDDAVGERERRLVHGLGAGGARPGPPCGGWAVREGSRTGGSAAAYCTAHRCGIAPAHPVDRCSLSCLSRLGALRLMPVVAAR